MLTTPQSSKHSITRSVKTPAAIDDSRNLGAWRLIRRGGLAGMFFLGGLSIGLYAQTTGNSTVSMLGWQESPGVAGAPPVPGSLAVPPQSSASIAGTVQDANGIAAPGVPVTLSGQDNGLAGTVATDDTGSFLFAQVPAGTYRVKILVAGLQPFVSDPVTVNAGERRDLPVVKMQIATKTSTVDVVATLNDVAQSQVKEQEQQRILGLLPNFYTSYIWNAAPMSSKLKFKLALRSTIDPFTFLVAGAVAGLEQEHKTFPGYGQGAEGYAKRYGATYADTVSGRMFGAAIFPVLFHQDPRYFYRGTGSFRTRLGYALLSTFVCRGDDGRLEPNYSRVLGGFAAAGLSNVYRAPGDRKASLTFRNGLIVLAGGAADNVLREFLSRKLTPKVPSFANGKP